MKTNIITAFIESAQNGKNEEIGSLDQFTVGKQGYIVQKAKARLYFLYVENEFSPIAEIRGGDFKEW